MLSNKKCWVPLLVILAILITFVLSSCGPTPDMAATEEAIAQRLIATMTAQAPTVTLTPTATVSLTSIPTDTPAPTDTPIPTGTPTLTDTPVPTVELATPTTKPPTSTPKPPTPTIQPVGLEQNVTAGAWQFHIEWVKREKVIYCAYSDPQMSQGIYAIVRLWATNLSSGTDYMANTLDLVVYDDKGRTSKGTDLDAEFCANWQWCCAGNVYDDLNPGIESPMTVVWDIAPDVEYLYLKALADDGSVSIPITLGHFSEIASENPY